MIEMILMMSLAQFAPAAQSTAQFQPCVWPNKCAVEEVKTAQFQPCVWPNKCAAPVEDLAINGPCSWPRVCSQDRKS